MESFIERVRAAQAATEDNCTYTLPPLRNYPSEILHTYGLEVFVTPFFLATASHVYWCCFKWSLFRHKPYGSARDVWGTSSCPHRANEGGAVEKEEEVPQNGADDEESKRSKKIERKRRATYQPTTALFSILGFMIPWTQVLACSVDGCACGELLTLRTPTIFLLVLVHALALLLPMYMAEFDEAVLARLPRTLVCDDRMDCGSSDDDAKADLELKDKKPLLGIEEQDSTSA